MNAEAAGATADRSAFLSRSILFVVLWLIVMGPALKDLPIGLVAAGAAAWSTLSLWPSDSRLSTMGILRFVLRFVPQSVVAGLSVARFALLPGYRLQPGFYAYKTQVSAGMARRAFCAVMSLQPGKLPVAVDGDGVLLIHCLNGTKTAAEEIAADERACLSMIRPEARNV